jgi:hypothetical protein
MSARVDVVADLRSLAAAAAEQLIVGGVLVELAPGQLVTSERQLAARWQWSRKRVCTFLGGLERAGAIAIERLGRLGPTAATRITVSAIRNSDSPRSRARGGHKGPQGATERHSYRVVQPELALVSGPQGTASVPTPLVNPSVVLDLSPPQGGSGGNRGDVLRTIEEPKSHTPPRASAGEPAHERYARELCDTLNQAQLANPRIDSDTYRPLSPNHRATREKAFAIYQAHVPLEFAREYVRTEGLRYVPKGSNHQIASLAYFTRLIGTWIRREASRAREGRRNQEAAPARVVAIATPRARGREHTTGEILGGWALIRESLAAAGAVPKPAEEG